MTPLTGGFTTQHRTLSAMTNPAEMQFPDCMTITAFVFPHLRKFFLIRRCADLLRFLTLRYCQGLRRLQSAIRAALPLVRAQFPSFRKSQADQSILMSITEFGRTATIRMTISRSADSASDLLRRTMKSDEGHPVKSGITTNDETHVSPEGGLTRTWSLSGIGTTTTVTDETIISYLRLENIFPLTTGKSGATSMSPLATFQLHPQ